jgi:hypothetical protein
MSRYSQDVVGVCAVALHKSASLEIDQAAGEAIAGLSNEEAFAHAQRLTDLTRPMTPQEELEFP